MSTYELGIDDYDDVLKLAGAEVHNFAREDDYQGTWIAKVTYQGKTGFVRGYFGSCSHCDEVCGLGTKEEAIALGKSLLDADPLGVEGVKTAEEMEDLDVGSLHHFIKEWS